MSSPTPSSTSRSTTPQPTATTPTGGDGGNNKNAASSTSNNNKHKSTPSQEEALKKMLKLVNSLLSRNDCGPFREPVDWRGLELYDYPKIIKKMMDLGTVKRKIERKQYKVAYECAQDIRLVWKNCATYNMEGSDFWLLAKSFSKRFEDKYKKIKAEYDTGEDEYGEEDDDENEMEFDDGDGDADSSGGASSSKKRGSSSPKNDDAVSSSSSKKNLPPNDASLDVKVYLASNIFLLSGMELGHVISKIELKCPQALEHSMCNTTANMKRTTANFLKAEHCEINIDALDNKTLNELDRYVREKVGTRHTSTGIMSTATTPNLSSNYQPLSSGTRGATAAASATSDSGGVSSSSSRPNKKRKK